MRQVQRSEPSGRYVFRVFFGEAEHLRDQVTEQLRDLGALIEWCSPALVAVDARDEAHAQQLADLLAGAEADGALYETGRTA